MQGDFTGGRTLSFHTLAATDNSVLLTDLEISKVVGLPGRRPPAQRAPRADEGPAREAGSAARRGVSADRVPARNKSMPSSIIRAISLCCFR